MSPDTRCYQGMHFWHFEKDARAQIAASDDSLNQILPVVCLHVRFAATAPHGKDCSGRCLTPVSMLWIASYSLKACGTTTSSRPDFMVPQLSMKPCLGRQVPASHDSVAIADLPVDACRVKALNSYGC